MKKPANRFKSISHGAKIAMALMLGLVLGCLGTIAFQQYNPKDEIVDGPHESISAVFGRIVKQNDMVSASQDYTFVEKATDTNKLFDIVEIPWTTNSFWYRYSGTIKASVDLTQAKWDQKNETTIVITLPHPTLDNVPDMEISGVLEENNNILNPIHVKDVDKLQRDCIAMSNEQAKKNGLLKEAKTNAADNLQHMFDVALGKKYQVQVEWLNTNKAETA